MTQAPRGQTHLMALRYLEFSLESRPETAAPIFRRVTWPTLLGCKGIQVAVWNQAMPARSPLARLRAPGPWTILDPGALDGRELRAVRAMAQAHFEALFWAPNARLHEVFALWPVQPTESGDLQRGLGVTTVHREAIEALASTGPAGSALVGFADDGMLLVCLATDDALAAVLDSVPWLLDVRNRR